MRDAEVTIDFDQGRTVYGPGDTLSGGYHFAPEEGRDLEAVEVSVLWFTLGKGDEDFGVHHFERLSFTEEEGMTASRPEPRFSMRLPRSPLSYQGVIVTIRWCVRVRVFFSGGRDLVGEAVFQLGEVPAAREVTP